MFRNVRDYFKSSTDPSDNKDNANEVNNIKNNIKDVAEVNETICNGSNDSSYLHGPAYEETNDVFKEEKSAESIFNKNYASFNNLENMKNGCNKSNGENNRNGNSLGDVDGDYKNSSSFSSNFDNNASRGVLADKESANNSNEDAVSAYSASAGDCSADKVKGDNSKEDSNDNDSNDVTRGELSSDRGSSTHNDNSRKDKGRLSSSLSDVSVKRRKMAEGDTAEDVVVNVVEDSEEGVAEDVVVSVVEDSAEGVAEDVVVNVVEDSAEGVAEDVVVNVVEDSAEGVADMENLVDVDNEEQSVQIAVDADGGPRKVEVKESDVGDSDKGEEPNDGVSSKSCEEKGSPGDAADAADAASAADAVEATNAADADDEKVSYLQDKLELLLAETKRYTEKLSGQRLKMSMQMKANKARRCALTEKEEDYMLMKDANDDDETFILKQPDNINGCMKPYQIEGLNWLYQLYRHKINGILADEMGLGKTLQTISLLCYLRFNKNIKRKSIIICPRSTLDNWYEEIKKWCTEMKAFKYYGSKEQRRELNKKVLHTDYDVLLTTYEIVIKDKSSLYDIDWFFLIIDEAHRIKNDKSVLSSSVRFLKSDNRLLITGTPLHNNLKELWSLLNFLMPKIFDNSEEFDNLFNISKISTNDNKQNEIITQLHTILKPFMLRRLKVEVEQSLPPKREIYIFVGMSKLQKKLYSDILSKNIDVINAMTGSKNQMLNILMQLRKCCNHPYLFDGIEEPPYIEGNHLIETSGKMSLLDKLLPRLKKENSRVLLFSQMTRLLDIIDDYCRWKNYEYLRIDGSTVGDERQIRINQFNEPNSKYFIFLLSTRAGGIGINLTTADIVILFDSDYNPQMDIQAMDRAHRIGQKKRVIVYRFVTQNSVEEKIVERAAKKLKLDSLIIQKGKLNLNNKENNKQELHDILNFGAPEVYKTQDISSISDEDIDIILADAEKRTMEIENKLKNLENIFDLSNISLDGGLNMYNSLGKDGSYESSEDDEEYSDSANGDEGGGGSSGGNNLEGMSKKKRKNINKIRSTIKKFLKNNKKNMTFLDLGERKSKWKVMNTACGRTNKKKMVLQGWRVEAKGGHDFQFFNNDKLDELEKMEEKWNNYCIREQKIKDIIQTQVELPDFEKILTVHEFLDIHAKNIYDIVNLICPDIFYENGTNGEDKEEAVNGGSGSAKDVLGGANHNDNGKDSTRENNNDDGRDATGKKLVKRSSSSENNDTGYYKGKIVKLLESKKKLHLVKFKDKNVKNCYDFFTNFVKRHIGGESQNEGSSSNRKNKKAKKNVENDISRLDIDKIKEEKQELLNQGFSKWNKAEFNKLMNGLIIYGSEDIDFIYEKYFGNSKKTLEEIKAYLRVFFRKYHEVKGGLRLFDKIRKSDLQRQIIQEENDMIANFVEKQLSDGVDTIDKLQLPPSLRYENMHKDGDALNAASDVKEEKEKSAPKEEDILYYERENKILLWLLYQEGVVQTKSIHILTPYYWSEAYDFFKYASTPLENIEYKCRLIIDAIVGLGKRVREHASVVYLRNSKALTGKERRKN
ncbi:chromatin remodeling protein, putative [Plasmodium ovale curtisi]|uniref:Chromatin remodeling protein, putative n=1 Tax=Plasmodium ovale curtisi TaxID=864141 RepID=A0A1A8VS27_PLAOA|nr:chromatin remodeling protein, putative [Plasmodium ovale curtisi]